MRWADPSDPFDLRIEPPDDPHEGPSFFEEPQFGDLCLLFMTVTNRRLNQVGWIYLGIQESKTYSQRGGWDCRSYLAFLCGHDVHRVDIHMLRRIHIISRLSEAKG